MTKNRRYFTLIEVLVAIAIIGILASMLLPVLNNAKQKAKEIACSNNIKGLGIAANLYKDDHDGLMRGELTNSNLVTTGLWHNGQNVGQGVLYEHEYTSSLQSFFCPARTQSDSFWDPTPETAEAKWGLNSAAVIYGDYAWGSILMAHGDSFKANAADRWPYGFNVDQMGSNYPIFVDAFSPIGNPNGRDYLDFTAHEQLRFNVGFIDGSVKSVNIYNISTPARILRGNTEFNTGDFNGYHFWNDIRKQYDK